METDESSWLRFPPIPSHPHTEEAGAEQEQGGGLGDGGSIGNPGDRSPLTDQRSGDWSGLTVVHHQSDHGNENDGYGETEDGDGHVTSGAGDGI